jgi:iron complex transport system ATP-binding protein
MLIVAVTHDLNLAATYSDRVIVLDHGRLAANSDPCDALTVERIRAVFGVESTWLRSPGGQSWIAYGQ